MSGSVVIVGSGQAGVATAFKLRALGHTGNITLLNAEPSLPYHRPPLSKKYLSDGISIDRLHIKNAALYESERIELLTGCRAITINRSERNVSLNDSRLLGYDNLILATGARARSLSLEQGEYAPNVHTFRTLYDAELLRKDMRPGRRMLIVGGGYIGLETAAVARSLDMQVTLIERDTRILGRVASAETASYFRTLHQENGVQIREGTVLQRLGHGSRGAETAQLTDGTAIDTDVVVVGVGVVPEVRLAEQAGLHVDNGIVVDSTGRTSDPSIYAAGDCACFPYKGRRIRLESVQNAVDMAEDVARSIVGSTVRQQPVPWFWSDQYSTKLQIAGLNLGYTRAVVRKGSKSTLSIWYYDGPRFISIDAINDAKAFMTAKRWLGTGHSPAPDEISNPTVPLNAVSLSSEAALTS